MEKVKNVERFPNVYGRVIASFRETGGLFTIDIFIEDAAVFDGLPYKAETLTRPDGATFQVKHRSKSSRTYPQITFFSPIKEPPTKEQGGTG